jgi:hypothetical protein
VYQYPILQNPGTGDAHALLGLSNEAIPGHLGCQCMKGVFTNSMRSTKGIVVVTPEHRFVINGVDVFKLHQRRVKP